MSYIIKQFKTFRTYELEIVLSLKGLRRNYELCIAKAYLIFSFQSWPFYFLFEFIDKR